MPFQTINPATGEPQRRFDGNPPGKIPEEIRLTHAAHERWRALDLEARSRSVRRLSEVLRSRGDAYATLMVMEMGKPIRQALAEVEKCADLCEELAVHGPALLAPEPVATAARKSYVSYQPLGVLLAIMPWNFPFWQVLRCAVPALLAGNGVLLKHAPNVPGCACALDQLFREAGFPEHLFRTLLVEEAHVPTLIEHPLVRGVALTGSVAAGRAVAALAGAALKKTVLELGGSDPAVVLADADLDLAAETCAASRLVNSGQSCIAAKRFVVVNEVRWEFEKRLVERMAAARLGDPLDEATEVGPLAREDLRGRLHSQVEASVAAGARCVLGGTVPAGRGFFYPPTVLSDVGPGMPAYEEELFGPVAAIVPVADEATAIRVANDTPYGLGASVFTRDRERGERIAARQLEAGNCFVNALVRSHPRLPFGGVKDSGYGRELGVAGLREFVNLKTVWVE